MSSYTANNKLIYTWTRGTKPVPASLLTSYAESIILDGDKRTIWHKGRQYGNSYYGSAYGESFNDFINNNASGEYSHAEGTYTAAKGLASHAENALNVAYGAYTSASGIMTYAIGAGSHSEGLENVSYGAYSHVEGQGVLSYGHGGHAEGGTTLSYGDYSHAEGFKTVSYGDGSHSEGLGTTSYGAYSHVEGYETLSYGDGGHAEGGKTLAYGNYSHSEGFSSVAYGNSSHSEGLGNASYGESAHSEGLYTVAYGNNSHAEGYNTVAYGESAHAEGHLTYAIGDYSLASGEGTQAYNEAEFATGRWNVSYDGEDGIHEKTIFTIGNGSSYDSRSNIVSLTENAAYISKPAYFGDYIHGSVTYSYVDYFKNVTVEQLFRALFDSEEKYTQPVLYTHLSYFLNGLASPIPATDDYIIVSYDGEVNVRTTMEVGTELHANVNVYWPDSLHGGTRSSVTEFDYDTIDPSMLGYSYGVLGSAYVKVNQFNDVEYKQTSLNKVAYFATINQDNSATYTTLLIAASYEDSPYNIIGDMTVPCDESTYMLYSRLKKQGAVQISYDGWFDKQAINMPFKWMVDARYRWFAGITQELPTRASDLRRADSGFLGYPSADTVSEIVHKVSVAESLINGYFWVAVPNMYTSDLTSTATVEVKRGDGVIWNLVSPQQPLGIVYARGELSNMPIGENAAQGYTPSHRITQSYDIYYVKLTAGPLGHDAADEISIKFTGSEPGSEKPLICTDEAYGASRSILLEDGTGMLEYDGN